jgi:molecular chaperone DnaK
VAAIKSAVKELEQVSHALSKVMYENAGAGEEASQAGAAENGAADAASQDADDAIDAEFEVKKD